MPNEEDDKSFKMATEEEVQLVRDQPALFANKFYLTMTPQGAKLTFAEVNSDIDFASMRAAVFLQISDVVQLQKVLTKVVKDNVIEHPVIEG